MPFKTSGNSSQQQQTLPTIILADWNAPPHHRRWDEQALELECLQAEEDLLLLLPDHPTWKDKIYDFFALTMQTWTLWLFPKLKSSEAMQFERWLNIGIQSWRWHWRLGPWT
jgi:hypothetical protein